MSDEHQRLLEEADALLTKAANLAPDYPELAADLEDLAMAIIGMVQKRAEVDSQNRF